MGLFKKNEEWIVENNIATTEELIEIEESARKKVLQSRNNAWKEYLHPIKEQAAKAVALMQSAMVNDMDAYNLVQETAKRLQSNTEPLRRDVLKALFIAINATKNFPAHKEHVRLL